MAETIQHRRLRNESGDVLRRVQAGETFQITNHGAVVAILSPAGEAAPPLRMRVASVRGGFAQLPRLQREHRVQDELDDLRSER